MISPILPPTSSEEFRLDTILTHRRCHGSEEVAPACGPFVLPASPGNDRAQSVAVSPIVQTKATQFKRQTSSVSFPNLARNRYSRFFSLSEPKVQNKSNPVKPFRKKINLAQRFQGQKTNAGVEIRVIRCSWRERSKAVRIFMCISDTSLHSERTCIKQVGQPL